MRNLPLFYATNSTGTIDTGNVSDASDASTVPDQIEKNSGSSSISASEHVKELIAGLERDPDAVTEDNRASIEEARAAYDALSIADQQQLDTETLAKEQSYGRILESAEWALEVLVPIDNSTGLTDGDYTKFIHSSSNLGKSNSRRTKSWSIAKLTAKGGYLAASIRCEGESTFRTLRIGNITYTANVIDGIPEFEVPFKENETLYFTVDTNEKADSIAYALTSSIDERPASADEKENAKQLATQGSALGNDTSYTEETRALVVNAAAKLLALASKETVMSIELQVAQDNLDLAKSTLTHSNVNSEQAAFNEEPEPTVDDMEGNATPDSRIVTASSEGKITSKSTTANKPVAGNASDSSSEATYPLKPWIPAAAILFLLVCGMLFRCVLFSCGVNAPRRPV